MFFSMGRLGPLLLHRQRDALAWHGLPATPERVSWYCRQGTCSRLGGGSPFPWTVQDPLTPDCPREMQSWAHANGSETGVGASDAKRGVCWNQRAV